MKFKSQLSTPSDTWMQQNHLQPEVVVTWIAGLRQVGLYLHWNLSNSNIASAIYYFYWIEKKAQNKLGLYSWGLGIHKFKEETFGSRVKL